MMSLKAGIVHAYMNGLIHELVIIKGRAIPTKAICVKDITQNKFFHLNFVIKRKSNIKYFIAEDNLFNSYLTSVNLKWYAF